MQAAVCARRLCVPDGCVTAELCQAAVCVCQPWPCIRAVVGALIHDLVTLAAKVKVGTLATERCSLAWYIYGYKFRVVASYC